MPENDVRSGIHAGGGFPPGTVVVFSILALWATVGYPHVYCTRDPATRCSQVADTAAR
jgi:hypothetical protein